MNTTTSISQHTRLVLWTAVSGFALLLQMASYAHAQDTSADSVSSTFPEPRAANQDEFKPHLGVRGGFTSPESQYDNAFEYGVEVGFQPYIPFGLGLELTHFSSDAENARNADLNRTSFLLRGTYNFGSSIPVVRSSYVGLGLGPVFDNIDNTAYTRMGTNLIVGFDIPLTPSGAQEPSSFSLGATANYLFVSSAAEDTFGLNGQVKYWF